MAKCCNSCNNVLFDRKVTVCALKDENGCMQSIINPEKFSCLAYEPSLKKKVTLQDLL